MTRKLKLTEFQLEILEDYDAQMAARAALERKITVLSSYLEDVEGESEKGLVKLLKRTDLDADERAAVTKALRDLLHGSDGLERQLGQCGYDPWIGPYSWFHIEQALKKRAALLEEAGALAILGQSLKTTGLTVGE